MVVAVACSLLCCASAACSGNHANPPGRIIDSTVDVAAVAYRRVNERFANGLFFKPASPLPTGRAGTLAPILVQELEAGALAPPARLRPATWTVDAAGRPVLDASRSTIYFDSSTAVLDGVPFDQVSYLWWYAPADDARNPVGASPATAWRGVRLTLDDQGFMLIGELLHPQAGVAEIYIARSVEEAAMRAFDGPLPGRRHAIEADPAAVPDVVVARVIEDGPVPMGPMIYQSRPDRTITTLLCRCMPAQIDNLVDGIEYELRPTNDLRPLTERVAGGAASQPASAEPFPSSSRPSIGVASLRLANPGMHDPTWLERALRLPPDLPSLGR